MCRIEIKIGIKQKLRVRVQNEWDDRYSLSSVDNHNVDRILFVRISSAAKIVSEELYGGGVIRQQHHGVRTEDRLPAQTLIDTLGYGVHRPQEKGFATLCQKHTSRLATKIARESSPPAYFRRRDFAQSAENWSTTIDGEMTRSLWFIFAPD